MNIGDIKEVKIETLIYGGDGMGYLNGQVVFVPLTAPDDSLRVKISSLDHDYARAEIVDIVEPSSTRIEPPCEVFGECGGCQWQHLNYIQQLMAKTEIVRQALVREGKIIEYHLRPIIPSPLEFNYRHRMQFSVNHRDRTPHLGLNKKKTHDLVEMQECKIAHPLINLCLNKMRDVLSCHDNRLIQGMDVTVDGEGQKLLVVFHFKKGELEEQKMLYQYLVDALPQTTGGILRVEEYKKAQSILMGQRHVIYPTVGYKLFIGPETFIQVNRQGNIILVQTVLDMIEEMIGHRRVKILELHNGAGNFSLPLSEKATELMGVESCPQSVELARKSLWTQDITNCQLLSKSDLKGIRFLLKSNHTFELLVMDPPRSGCKHILEYIPQLGVQYIIYVSCNPSSLARDLGILAQYGYQLDCIQPIDMFPQTYHVECVARLTKK